VAPLTATVAATVAVGAGFMLTRASRARGEAGPDEGGLGLQPGEPLSSALKRTALAQIDIALEHLPGDGATPDATAVHETRKALKRARALLRLVEHELQEGTFAREDAALRRAGRQLADTRDAEVMMSTLDALIARHPRKLGARKGVRRARAALLARREREQRRAQLEAGSAGAIAELRAARARMQMWQLPEMGETQLLQTGLARLYRRGRVRHRRAARASGSDSETMHEWRKHVKHLRYSAEMLERSTTAQTPRSKRALQLLAVAKQADELGEMLGEEHDLSVLAAWVRANGARKRGHRPRVRRSERIGRGTRKLLLRAIASRRAELRRKALRRGKRLYKHSPERFVQTLS
jgi:CHAD domain-containing protein